MTPQKIKLAIWLLRLLAAIILLQTLFFKFTGAAESVYIFSTIGMEPWGRIGSGVAEGLAAILILFPATSAIGALIGLSIMSGALFFHFTKLGIVVLGDNGQLFIYALLVFGSCLALVIIQRKKLIALIRPANRTQTNNA